MDMVNHPPHYKTKGGLEAIDVIEAFTEELKGPDAVYTGQVLKYTLRWPKKNGIEDLKKARWYLERLIEKLEKEERLKTSQAATKVWAAECTAKMANMNAAVMESIPAPLRRRRYEHES